jgi:hypothetical protein
MSELTPQLKRYYEARISMFGEEGWRDLMDDLREIEKATNDIAGIQDEKALHFKRGELSMIRWMLGIEDMSREAYDQLKADKEEE